jgi:hypothetical protein
MDVNRDMENPVIAGTIADTSTPETGKNISDSGEF